MTIRKQFKARFFLGMLAVGIFFNAQAKAKWTFVSYVQGDNNLSDFALLDIQEMQAAMLTDSVNVLVQWDQPNNNKTWRYRIVKGGKIEDASLSAEMGINPGKELVSMMQWAKTKYDAERWCMVLWNHGYGVLDPARKLRIPPYFPMLYSMNNLQRGILFDDSQGTYLNNQNLTASCVAIKKILGKNLDILGMDACLMAMGEIGDQVKDSVDYLVASRQTEPGDGWDYEALLTKVCSKDSSALDVASAIVSSYKNFYQIQTNDFTMSAMKLNQLATFKTSFQKVLNAIEQCRKNDVTKTKSALRSARKNTISFELDDYIDLYDWLVQVSKQFSKYKTQKQCAVYKKSVQKTRAVIAQKYRLSIDSLLGTIKDCQAKINNVVVYNAVGAAFKNAHGLSIYYPQSAVDPSYPLTVFAQTTGWVNFLKTYRS